MSVPTIAVFGATGSQGGSVVHYLKSSGQYHVRALTRNPARYDGPADEVVAADLNDEQSLSQALEGVYGVFLVTNFWQEGTDEIAQAKAAIRAAKAAGVKHLVWSSLPDVAAISDGKWNVPHFTNKAQIDPIVREAGFPVHTIVQPAFYFENLLGAMAASDLGDGTKGWAIPIDPNARVIHMGSVAQMGKLVERAFSTPEKSHGKTLSMAAGLYSFSDIIAAFNNAGKSYSVVQVTQETFADLFLGAKEIGQMMGYFEDHTYMGPEANEHLAVAEQLNATPLTPLEQWVKTALQA
ncbi:MAG: NmrA/HSCARG family protein [Marinobacter sp.]|uniref:NmrA/HSCARG family protein n=1 Tax=Marinobacter sp. TaxID=50741 RepID=UPI00299EE205|nr:NmrA/HSCARG family protein [Marinobacter sp.]MDX1755753.1 NmrA/HSCARG family protein [Marinobacter sp.]